MKSLLIGLKNKGWADSWNCLEWDLSTSEKKFFRSKSKCLWREAWKLKLGPRWMSRRTLTLPQITSEFVLQSCQTWMSGDCCLISSCYYSWHAFFLCYVFYVLPTLLCGQLYLSPSTYSAIAKDHSLDSLDNRSSSSAGGWRPRC